MKKLGILGAYLGVAFSIWPQYYSFHIVMAILLFLFLYFGPKRLFYMVKTVDRDVRALARFIRLKWYVNQARRRDLSMGQLFQENVQRHPNKVAFYYEDEEWTFQEVEDYSNKIANYFKTQGIKHGDSVALLMENRVEYVCIWLGLTKLGAIPALINTNLRVKPLYHCINIVNSVAFIFSADYQEAAKEIEDEVKDLKKYIFAKETSNKLFEGIPNLYEDIKPCSTTSPSEMKSVKFADKMVYIYTSGTTGLPKAAVIKHSRAAFSAIGMISMVGVTSSDILYDPLPMYHTVGGIIGPGMMLVDGVTIAIRRKFSASNFWLDCIKYDCTVAQYIGELCRYLLNTPPKPEDTQHKVKIMYGNGLRPQVWKQFQDRFKVPKICEFYGSTEGNANIINMDGKPGAVGFVSVILPWFYPCTLIKIDDDTGEPLRDSNGKCIICKPGEPGEFVGKIVEKDPVRDFHGYADKSATEKKIVCDVWRKGDKAFLSGDILVMDQEGYLYFRDRRGDTFRWKGENVSTTEVEGIISQVLSNSDVAVYGVEVPNTEGRAGMAAILDPEGTVNMDELANGISKQLPVYARPIFVRLLSFLDMTGTYKLKKVNLKKEGYDVSQVSDKLFLLDQKANKYIELTNDIYSKIQNGDIRF